ncbi:MAG TPA: hypothetical protein VMU19_03560 [Bryobacteraceae bacterium]|nr:hypothetical protein [Bryobacteraceae bacterium]
MDAASRASFKQRLREYLDAARPEAITGEVWRDLLRRFAPISESYLRELLWNTGLPFHQPYAGIRQHSFAELEESLLEMGRIYEEARSAGDRPLARYCRRQAIAAKARARFATAGKRATAGKAAEKLEMAEWLLVWLEDPAVFPAWVEARKRVLWGGVDGPPA